MTICAALGVATLAGCGGSDGDSLTQAAGGGGATTTAAAGANTASTTTAKSDGKPTPVDAFSGKCKEALAAWSQAMAGPAQLMTAGANVDLDKSIKQMEAFANEVPNEIKADYKVFAAGVAKYVKALQDSGYRAGQPFPTSPDALNKLTAAAKELDNAEFKAASDRLAKYFENNCK